MHDRAIRFERTPDQDINYGDTWADHYDEIFDTVDEANIDFLASLAGEPPRALELAIGTGRVALPLAARGVEVAGIDNSERMLSVVRSKPGAVSIRLVSGDMAEVPVDGTFPLVFLGSNTLFVLLTQERQVACFRNVADHLEMGGRFVIECFVPDLSRFDSSNTRMSVTSLGNDGQHSYEMSVYDPTRQRIDSQMVRRQVDGSNVVLPVSVRFAWPAELDLMAQMAGLELEDRWGWYDRRLFTASSGQHVSVYRKS